MNHSTELERALKNLTQLTGVTMQVDAQNETEARLAARQIHCLCLAYREKYDRNHFLRQLLTGEIPASSASTLSDAKRLHIEPERETVLYVLETDSEFDDTAMEILKMLFPARLKVYIVPMTADKTAVLYPAGDLDDAGIRQTACMMADTLNTEALISVYIAHSGVLPGIAAFRDGYGDVLPALRIGKLFYPEQLIFSCDRLGIGRLIDRLPKPDCEKFLVEVFGTVHPDWLNAEFSSVIDQFLQCNLNIAETARQSHMHRNTLIYRLEQVQKHTGLDLRRFEDAMTYRIASMILNYLQAGPS